MTAHWGIEDPARVAGDGQRDAFVTALRYLRRRIELFLALPLEFVDRMALKNKLLEIGRQSGASEAAREKT
jgi:arsenate reductase